MPRLKQKSSEQFIAQSSIGEKLSGGVFEHNLASGALRLVEINGKPQKLNKLGNKELKVREALSSGYFGIVNPNPEFINAEIDNLIIDEDSVPEAYFELKKRIAYERGEGDVKFTDAQKLREIKKLQKDQTESLKEWSEYLRSDENGHVYPDWFKVYVWESLKRMGEFDKKRSKFKKRTKSTTAPWPELNAEALAHVYDSIDTGVIQGGAVKGDDLVVLLSNGNFASLYAHALLYTEASAITPEMKEVTDGSWVKFSQIQGNYDPDYTEEEGEYIDDSLIDNETAMRLAGSLRGKDTGWCTAGTRTAAYQLSMGDFYVYYTKDKEGNDTIPRVAIRMENGEVAEVRGIESDQNLEVNMTDIVDDKLKTLPGGEEYYERLDNARRITEIDKRVKSGGELTPEDIIFLQFSGEINSFGWNEDPRIDTILKPFTYDQLADIVAGKIGYSELYELIKKDVDEDGYELGDFTPILKNIDKLEGDVLEEVCGRIEECGLCLDMLGDDIVDYAGKLFAVGVSAKSILEHRKVAVATTGRDRLTRRRFMDYSDDIIEELVAAGAKVDYVDGVLAVVARLNAPKTWLRRVHNFTYDAEEVAEVVAQLPYDANTKNAIINEFVLSDSRR